LVAADRFAVDPIKLGALERKFRRYPARLSDDERGARVAALKRCGPWAVADAAKLYDRHLLEEHVRQHGGTIVTDRSRTVDGRHTTTREVRRFKPRIKQRSNTTRVRVARHTVPCSGRPRAQATRSSAKSGDSPSDDDEGPSSCRALRGCERG
jgi:hypothetical protein